MRALISVAVALVSAVTLGAAPLQSDLDQFMSQVMSRRDDNWKKLHQYILEERELIDVRGPAGARIWGDRREYSWFMQEGVFVRSPIRANGVALSETDRREAERKFIEQAKEREKRDRTESASAAGSTDSSPVEGLFTGGERPRFVDSAYFLKFKFEPGQYSLVGREMYEGREALRIEYYPRRLHEPDKNPDPERAERSESRAERDTKVGETLQMMMNKVALITLWVDPVSYQVLRYTFDNVGFDFLPAAWALRVTDMKASMTMSQPFPDVWLPKSVQMGFGVMLAAGALDFDYQLEYYNYREATTGARIKLPGEP